MKRFVYAPEHTCSKMISFELHGHQIRRVSFYGGCDGNLKAIARLVEGMTVQEIEEKMGGILCGRRPTSCADQLTKAVRAALNGELEETDE